MNFKLKPKKVIKFKNEFKDLETVSKRHFNEVKGVSVINDKVVVRFDGDIIIMENEPYDMTMAVETSSPLRHGVYVELEFNLLERYMEIAETIAFNYFSKRNYKGKLFYDNLFKYDGYLKLDI